MKALKTIGGAEIQVTPNHSKRTFTIRKNGSKYRTYPMSKDEFRSCENMTGNDWANFLRETQDYYLVK
jgi:hypothetical protein